MSGAGVLGQHEWGVRKEEGGGPRAGGQVQEGSAGPARSRRSGWAVGLGATSKGCAAFIALLTDSLVEQVCVYPTAKDGTCRRPTHTYTAVHISQCTYYIRNSRGYYGEKVLGAITRRPAGRLLGAVPGDGCGNSENTFG